MYLTSLGEAFMGLSSMGFTCTSLFPKVEVVQWSVEVLGPSFRLHIRRASAVCSPRPRSAG